MMVTQAWRAAKDCYNWPNVRFLSIVEWAHVVSSAFAPTGTYAVPVVMASAVKEKTGATARIVPSRRWKRNAMD